jgi:hypothetical protein
MPADRQPSSRKPRKRGRRPFGCLETVLVLILVSLVLGCLLPPVIFYLSYGRGPLDGAGWRKVKDGMTTDEVMAVIGPPHKKSRNEGQGGGEKWIYFKDTFGWNFIELRFNKEGHVEGLWSQE